MKFTIKENTTAHVGLCGKCTNALVVEGMTSRGGNFMRVLCNAVHPFMEVRGCVERCSDYIERGKSTLNDMKRQAWLITTDSKNRSIGFVSPIERRKMEHKELRKWGLEEDE